jgi:hypothetical protein
MSNEFNFASARSGAAIVLALLLWATHSPGFSQESEGPTYTCPTGAASSHDQSPARCSLRAEVERLKVIQRRHEDRIMAVQGVHGMGIGSAAGQQRAVFVILVDQSWPPPQLPQRIDDVEVRLEQRAPVRLLDGAPACGQGGNPCHREQFPPPVRMGNSGGLEANSGACTLGFKACDLSSGRMVFVTNSHCNVVIPAPTCGLVTPGLFTDDWVHPGLFEQMGTPYQIGDVAGHAAPTCPGNNNLTDATKVTSPNTLTSMAMRDVPFYLSITPGDPLPGDQVQKSGRTTGLTQGVVTAVNVTVAVPSPAEGGFCCGPLTMKQQVEWQPDDPTAPGDSGSAVVSTEAPPRVVGLLWGSDGTYTYANHIDNVLSALNISLNPTACLSDCIYARAARTLPPAGTGNPLWSYTPSGLIELGHRFRGQVLQRSHIGQQLIGYFYQFSDEAIALARRSPGLLARTAQTLLTIAPSVRELVESGEARVPAAHIRAVDDLLAAYQAGASAELELAIRDTRKQLKSPDVLRALGILPESSVNPVEKR